jgi:hypothetical protein
MIQQIYLPEYILNPFFGNVPMVGVEIGVLDGHNTISLLKKFPLLKLYAIDPWIHQEGKEYEARLSQEYFDNMYEKVLNRLKEFGDRVVILKMKSDDAVSIVNELVDFVWIDGDHSEEQVARDIDNWITKIKPRSIFGGHDWEMEHIRKLVREKIGEPKLGEPELRDNVTWWFEFENNKIKQ